jgi:cytochrome P450 family 628
VAGSDSTAAALTHLFFQLVHEPELVLRLQQQFDALPNLAHDNLQTVELLDAVINETLRLHPPVPSGTQRVTPPQGLRIGDNFIPGDVIVQVPSHTVFRGMILYVLYVLYLSLWSCWLTIWPLVSPFRPPCVCASSRIYP